MAVCRSGLRVGRGARAARGRDFPIACFLVCAALGFVAAAGPVGADVVNWTRFDGDWSVPSNWSSNPLLPGPNDDAVNPTVSRITHSTGDDTIKSFAGTGPFTLSGGSLSRAGPSRRRPPASARSAWTAGSGSR